MELFFQELGRSEKGQSLVEMALIFPVIILLAMLPVDYFRVINNKMTLCSAASESLAQLTYASVQNDSVSDDLLDIIDGMFGDRLNTGLVVVEQVNQSELKQENYHYYVYTSEKADEADFHDQFNVYPSNYHYVNVELQLKYDVQMITFWGELFFGGSSTSVTTPLYVKAIYAGGYNPGS